MIGDPKEANMSAAEIDPFEVRRKALMEAAEAIRSLIVGTAEEHAYCEHRFKDGAESALYEVLFLIEPGLNLGDFLAGIPD